eukprot:3978995-Amphidinium_carterae.1
MFDYPTVGDLTDFIVQQFAPEEDWRIAVHGMDIFLKSSPTFEPLEDVTSQMSTASATLNSACALTVTNYATRKKEQMELVQWETLQDS